MKLAFISPYPPSQVTLNEYGYHLVRSFRNKPGIDQLIVLTNHLADNEAYKRYADDAITLLPSWRFNDPFTCWHLYRQLKRLKPDVVILNLQFMTFGEGKVPAALGLLMPLICKWLGIPSVVILHNITETVKLDTIGMAGHPWKEKLLLKIGSVLTRLILKADVVGVTISQYVNILETKYQAQNVVLLPHGNFELPERKPLGKTLESVNLMAFGKFGTYKKVEVLLEALQILRQRHPGKTITATVAGTDNPNVKGYLAGIQQQYANVPGIYFTGYVPEEKVADIFQESSFVVFPYTTTTGSSGILHQAGSYARACILPKIDDLERVVEEEGYGGAYFETDNAQSLADAVDHLLENPDERMHIEEQNYAAARGLPMNELANWYLGHIKHLLKTN